METAQATDPYHTLILLMEVNEMEIKESSGYLSKVRFRDRTSDSLLCLTQEFIKLSKNPPSVVLCRCCADVNGGSRVCPLVEREQCSAKGRPTARHPAREKHRSLLTLTLPSPTEFGKSSFSDSEFWPLRHTWVTKTALCQMLSSHKWVTQDS